MDERRREEIIFKSHRRRERERGGEEAKKGARRRDGRAKARNFREERKVADAIRPVHSRSRPLGSGPTSVNFVNARARFASPCSSPCFPLPLPASSIRRLGERRKREDHAHISACERKRKGEREASRSIRARSVGGEKLAASNVPLSLRPFTI